MINFKSLFKRKLKRPKKNKVPFDSSPVQVRLVVSEDDENAEAEIAGTPFDGVKRVKSSHSAEDDVFAELNGSSRKESYRFEPNSKFTTIWIYAIALIVIAALFIAGLVSGSIVKSISTFFTAFSTFIIGLFIALVLEKPVSFLETMFFEKVCKLKKPGLRRGLSMLITYVLLIGLVFIIFRFVIPQLGYSAKDLYNQSESLYNSLINLIHDIEEFVPGMENGTISDAITNKFPDIVSFISTSVIPNFVAAGVTTAKTILNIFIALMISIYILYGKRNLTVVSLRTLYSLFPISRANNFSHTIQDCVDIFTNFIFGKSLDSLIIGILAFIVLSIGGFPYALLVSVIIGITNMIPYFGPFIGAVPGVILYLCISPKDAIAFVIIVFIIQQLDGLVIGPKILGDSTGLSPLWVIVGTTVGGVYGGVLGMFLGVPIIAVIAFLSNRIISDILNKKKIDVS